MHQHDRVALALVEIGNLDVAVTETCHQFSSRRMILSENQFASPIGVEDILFGIMR